MAVTENEQRQKGNGQTKAARQTDRERVKSPQNSVDAEWKSAFSSQYSELHGFSKWNRLLESKVYSSNGLFLPVLSSESRLLVELFSSLEFGVYKSLRSLVSCFGMRRD